MKNPALSLWLSAANRAAGWWAGHAANAGRRMQRAALDEAVRTIAPKPKRARRPKRRRSPR